MQVEINFKIHVQCNVFTFIFLSFLSDNSQEYTKRLSPEAKAQIKASNTPNIPGLNYADKNNKSLVIKFFGHM